MRVSLGEFRQVVRKLVREYVTNDSPYNARKDAHPDPGGATWDSGMDQDNAPLVGEGEEDYCDDHGGVEKHDPRWEQHADPTGKTWDSGLDESDGEVPQDERRGRIQEMLTSKPEPRSAKELIWRGCMAASWWNGDEAETVAELLYQELVSRGWAR